MKRLFGHFSLGGIAVCYISVSLFCLTEMTFGGPAMELELEATQSHIQVTPAYSNAVLEVLLPYFSDFAKKEKLAVHHPITKSDVIDCRILPWRNNDGEVFGASIETKEGVWLSFEFGNVNGFGYPDTYSDLQNPHDIKKFYGSVKISKDQAVKLAREAIKRAGIPLEDLFAEQEPIVTLPQINTNTVARYLISWSDPRGAVAPVVRMEINGKTGLVENFHYSPRNIKKPSPKVTMVVPAGHDRFDSMIPPSMNPDYAWKLIPMMFKAIDDYAGKLSLPIPYLLTTNNVAKVDAYNNEGWPHCEIWLTNGWRFVYRHTMVNGYYGPDNFFDSENRKIHVKDFDGPWNLTTNQAIEVVAKAIAKLGYPTNNVHMNFAPNVYMASVNLEHIPRLHFEWDYDENDDLQSRLEAEVNMDTGKLESLYYDDKAYWGGRPPIDIPIAVKK